MSPRSTRKRCRISFGSTTPVELPIVVSFRVFIAGSLARHYNSCYTSPEPTLPDARLRSGRASRRLGRVVRVALAPRQDRPGDAPRARHLAVAGRPALALLGAVPVVAVGLVVEEDG